MHRLTFTTSFCRMIAGLRRAIMTATAACSVLWADGAAPRQMPLPASHSPNRAYSWRLYFYAGGQRLTLWGRCRRTLLNALYRLDTRGITPNAYRAYQRNASGQLYRTSLRRLLAVA